MKVPHELLRKHDKPGPRYTSYPTAPVWSEEFGETNYRDALASAGQRSEPVSLYVHVPYCERLCWFCGCTTIITQDHDKGLPYVDTVIEEARMVREALGSERKVAQHHWGGGTPTFLPPDQIEKLFLGICKLFPLDDEAEVSIEVDPRVTTRDQLETLARIGFNRISMGVQDFDPKVQQAVHREQSYEQTRQIVEGARELGFLSVNVDLIYGLPHQTPDSFHNTLDLTYQLRPDRIAYYGYAHVPWLKKHQTVIDEATLPTGAEKLALYLMALESFQANGYEPIGMDHFALAEDELAVAARQRTLHRNFMGYSTHPAEDMVSFGMSAISEVGGAFAHNEKELRPWQEAIQQGRLPTNRGLLRSDDDERRRKLILHLMCRFRAAFDDHGGLEDFQKRYQPELEALQPMVADGLVTIDDSAIEITEIGRLFVRNVCMVFDAYLQRQKEQEGPMFSRTV